jgi:hypothetical protein
VVSFFFTFRFFFLRGGGEGMWRMMANGCRRERGGIPEEVLCERLCGE